MMWRGERKGWKMEEWELKCCDERCREGMGDGGMGGEVKEEI